MASLVLIALNGLTLLSAGLGRETAVLSYHEVIVAESAKEMAATGKWLVPHIAGVPDVQKPPLTQWILASLMAWAGGDREWVLRLPSVVAGVALALLIAWTTARWLGDRVGLLAGLMQPSFVYVQKQARLAEADMLLGVFVCGAMVSYAIANVPHPRRPSDVRPWSFLFYALCGLAALTKGPVGPAVILPPCALHAGLARDRSIVRFLLNPAALVVAALPLAWPLAAILAEPGVRDQWIQHNVVRYVSGLHKREPAWFYVPHVLWLLLPWTPFVASGIATRSWRDAETGSFFAFLALWFGTGFLFFSSSAFKAFHYLLPILPPLTVFAAVGLLRYVRGRFVSRAPFLVLALLDVAGCAVGVVLVLRLLPSEQRVAATILVLALGAGLLLAISMKRARRWRREVAAYFALAWIVSVAVQLWIRPHDDLYRSGMDFAGRVNRLVPAGKGLLLVELPEVALSYYLERPLTRIDDVAELEGFALPETGVIVLAPEHCEERLPQRWRAEVLARSTEPLKTRDGRFVLTLVHLTSGGRPSPTRLLEKDDLERR